MLIAADLCAILIAAVVAKAMMLVMEPYLGLAVETFPETSWRSLEAPGAVIAGLFLAGTYRAGDRRRDPGTIFAGVALGLLLVFWHPLWQQFVLAGIEWAMLTVWIGSVAVAGRLLINRIVAHRRANTEGVRRALFVGTADAVAEALEAKPAVFPASVVRVGAVLTDREQSNGSLGTLADLPRVIHDHGVNAVLLCGRMDDAVLAEVVRCADVAGCVLTAQSRPYSLNGLEPQVVWHNGVPHIELTRPGMRGSHLVLKRTFDITVSAGLLLLLSPLLVVIAAIVRATSRGPVFFQQTRIGYGGKPFAIFKFRTMCVDAEARLAELQAKSVYGDARLFKMTNDPRVTTVGRFLRKSSLDELPQLWNVLRGSMSLVGPRPPIPREVALYEEKMYARFDMKPGVTGPWQVSGRNRITSFDEVIRLETNYMRRWTLWRDVSILLRTVPAVLRMDGAQ
ncbi:MAG: sugar transferase [Gemmatimonas sp.]